MGEPKRTPLYETHCNLGARMVEFAGWAMPLQYTSIVEEHRAVRTNAGLFDVSHMGEVEFTGPSAFETVQRLITNDLGRLRPGRALYTPMCTEEGGIVDDLIVYMVEEARFLVVVNAATTDGDYAWMKDHALPGTTVVNRSEEISLLALQGPKSLAILQELCDGELSALPRFGFLPSCRVAGYPVMVARTGYTGEDGFEIFCRPEDAPVIWGALLEVGWHAGVRPAGLGARDTLRLEAGYLLYGQDMDRTTTPLEAGLGWTVKFEKGEFIGRSALLAQREEGVKRRLVGMVTVERAIPRTGYKILKNGSPVGHVTSGSYAPTLDKNIAMGYVPIGMAEPGTHLAIEIRGRPVPAEVVKLPFYKRPA
ncbi:MAG: glycine cleavage system aminomethyltransferase GcvT [Armatimonadota bacterium]|nr:glycine cleavage system aminomethyltransferase GcvT [Armatimonadota bacterium]